MSLWFVRIAEYVMIMSNLALCSPEGYKVQPLFMQAYPDGQIVPLEVGDILLAEKKPFQYLSEGKMQSVQIGGQIDYLKGVLIEVKIGEDFGIHTEQLERFQDECCRMSNWRQKNPHVVCHAVWVTHGLTTLKEERQFNHYCFKYHIWGHIFAHDYNLVELLKDLNQPSKYQEFEPYIKRSHEEPTILAKMLRQFPQISSPMAIKLATEIIETKPYHGIRYWCGRDDIPTSDWLKDLIIRVIGSKMNGKPRKLAVDFIKWLEEGDDA